MSKSNQPRLKAAHTTAQLDALFTRAISADQRANKPASHTPPQERHSGTTSDTTDKAATASAESVERQGGAGERRGRIQQQVLPLERMQRLTVRFTKDEARLLEKARGVAREMGSKSATQRYSVWR
ncbi:MAG: hypothetical protein HC898_06495 [Phycisphaerales bacterium]|nr:hypothetical protein [Phycisphaerales bacterium]